MVALSIFIVVMTISMGSIISVFDANRKSRSLKTVLNNLNLAVESMSREIRFGTKYHCDYEDNNPIPIDSPRDCSYDDGGAESISFLSSDGVQINYKRDGVPSVDSRIEKKVDNDDDYGWITVTAPEVIINKLTFYVLGAEDVDDDLQPRVVIVIKGYAGAGGKGQSDFTLQTTVSQRALDIDI